MFLRLTASPFKMRLTSMTATVFFCLILVSFPFPTACAESNKTRQETSAVLAINSEAGNSADSLAGQPSEHGCRDEDCCFGCAHMFPGVTITDDAVFDLKSVSAVTANRLMLEPPLRGTYHPPRSV